MKMKISAGSVTLLGTAKLEKHAIESACAQALASSLELSLLNRPPTAIDHPVQRAQSRYIQKKTAANN